MNWRRVHPEKTDPRHYKEWRGGSGKYRIIWRDQIWGVAVSPGYQCALRVLVPATGVFMWDLVEPSRRSLYRTLKAAKDTCKRHANRV